MSKKNNPGDPRIKKNAFVHKLYTMLNDPNLNHLIWWTTNNVEGNTFALYPGKEFANCLTQYFKHGNVASFVRQLHMYGFHKVSDPNSSSSSSSSSSYSMNSMNKDVPPIWEFKHLSGKFKKGDEKSLAFIKRRSSSNSSGSRNNSYNDTLQNHQPIYQEYPVVLTYDPYNLGFNFHQQHQAQHQQQFMYYNQPQPVPQPPLPQPPPALPPGAPQQQLPSSYQQKMPTSQYMYGQTYFQYPPPLAPSSSSSTVSLQATDSILQPPAPPPSVPPPGTTFAPHGSHLAEYCQFTQPIPHLPLQQPQVNASSTPQIQHPAPRHIEQQQYQPSAPAPAPATITSQLPPQPTSVDQIKTEPLNKSPHLANSGSSANLQFRKIWDDNNNNNNGSSARQRNPSFMFDPLSTIPPTTTLSIMGLKSEHVSTAVPTIAESTSPSAPKITSLPPPSQINRSTSLNAVPTSRTTNSITPPESYRRSTTPLLPSISQSHGHLFATASIVASGRGGPPRLATSIPRNSSPLAISTTLDSSNTPIQHSPSQHSPSIQPKKPSLFSSSLQERLRPSVFEVHHLQGNNSPPISNQRTTTPSTSISATSTSLEQSSSVNSKQGSIVSNKSSIFSNKSSITSIGSNMSYLHRPSSLSLMTKNSIHVPQPHPPTVLEDESINSSRTWTPVNGNHIQNNGNHIGIIGAGNISTLSPIHTSIDQRSVSASPSIRIDDKDKSKKVSVNSLLDEQHNEDVNLGAKSDEGIQKKEEKT